MTATLRSPFNLSAHLRPTVGDQKISFTSVDHMGWMLCDGRALGVADYGLLFGVIGTTFGGSGSTFQLPDFRGTVPGISGRPNFNSNVVNLSNYAIGTYTGEQQHQLVIAEMPSHNHGVAGGGQIATNNRTSENGAHSHTITDPGHAHAYSNQIQSIPIHNITTQTDAADNTNTPQSTSSTITGISINSTIDHYHTMNPAGGDLYHNNMQPTLFGGNMFIYSGKNMQAYFPYTWVGSSPASSNNVAPTPGNVLVF